MCFKRQGDSSDQAGIETNDFLLGIQTEFQQDMFVSYTSKLIFQLVTVLVVDDYDEGIPVAFLISNKESADVLRVFFLQASKKDVGTPRPKSL